MTKQKLKAAIVIMVDRENAARDVAAKLNVSLSTLYAYVGVISAPRPRDSALFAKHEALRLPADVAL
jgi:hypothetical protein